MKPIGPDETEIIGKWIVAGSVVNGDPNCERILRLITDGSLQFLKHSPLWGAWETLFRDPTDGRYWERFYPQSECHGGGPPALRVINPDEALRKYQIESP